VIREWRPTFWTQLSALIATVLVGIALTSQAITQNDKTLSVLANLLATLIVGFIVGIAKPNAVLEHQLRNYLDEVATRLRGTNVRMKELEEHAAANGQLVKTLKVTFNTNYVDRLRRRLQEELERGQPEASTLMTLGVGALREAEHDHRVLQDVVNQMRQLEERATAISTLVSALGISFDVAHPGKWQARLHDEFARGQLDARTLVSLGVEALREAESDERGLQGAATANARFEDVLASAMPFVLRTGSQAHCMSFDLLAGKLNSAKQQLLSERRWADFDHVVERAAEKVSELEAQAKQYVSQGGRAAPHAEAGMTLQQAFAFLHVSADASEDEIRAAFRQMSLKVHPDTNPGGGGLIMTLLNQAMDLVCKAKGIHR
jgi:flagellar biosynthesis protein FliQ